MGAKNTSIDDLVYSSEKDIPLYHASQYLTNYPHSALSFDQVCQRAKDVNANYSSAELRKRWGGISRQAVFQFIKRLGMADIYRGKKTKYPQDKIIKTYEPCDGNATRAAKVLGYAPSTVIECWRKAGLKARGTLNRILSESEKREIIEAYGPCNGNAAEAERRLPYGYTTIFRHWRNAGLKAKGRSI